MGNFASPLGLFKEVFGRIQVLGVTLLAVNLNDILAAAALPHFHSDPFDRMLVAQALAEDVPLITIDPEISQYPVQIIWS